MLNEFCHFTELLFPHSSKNVTQHWKHPFWMKGKTLIEYFVLLCTTLCGRLLRLWPMLQMYRLLHHTLCQAASSSCLSDPDCDYSQVAHWLNADSSHTREGGGIKGTREICSSVNIKKCPMRAISWHEYSTRRQGSRQTLSHCPRDYKNSHSKATFQLSSDLYCPTSKNSSCNWLKSQLLKTKSNWKKSLGML